MIRHKLEMREILVLAVGILFGVISSLLAAPRQAVLSIPDYGEGNSEKTIFYRRGEEDIGEIVFTIPAREYSDARLKDMAKEVFDRLSEEIPGENPSMDEVRFKLALPDALPDFPFAITWRIENAEVITSEGEVINEDLEEAVLCVLEAELSYEDYIVSQEYCVRVLPKAYTSQELFEKELKEEINHYVKIVREETKREEGMVIDEIVLPDNMLGAEIYGSIPDMAASLIYPFLGVIGVIFMRVRKKESAKEAEKKRKEALLYAYPVFVNQLTLYLSAGMTVRAAFNQLVMHWHSHKETCMEVLLEETDCMLQMMKNGVSEKDAYRSFGRKCRHQEYQKLMALLVQTIEIGGKGVINSLEVLETEAFLMRKEQVRLKGETASTKLLFPMVLLLAVVMALLMVPGFYGMGI